MASELSSVIMTELRRPDGTSGRGVGATRTFQGADQVKDPAVAQQVKAPRPAQELKEQQDEAKLKETVRDLNEYVQVVRRNLQFSIDENSGRTIISVIDAETDEVIRQIPPETAVDLARRLEEQTGGHGAIFWAKA